MTFRTRILLAFLAAALIPMVAFAVGYRREMNAQLNAQFESRVEAFVAIINSELERRGAEVAARLVAIRSTLQTDNRFRLATVQNRAAQRPYLLDIAQLEQERTGLQMFQIQDESGRILSSGHFRNDFDRVAPEIPGGLVALNGPSAFIRTQTAEGSFVAWARVDSLTMASRRLFLVGGVRVDSDFLAGLAPDPDMAVLLRFPDGRIETGADITSATIDAWFSDTVIATDTLVSRSDWLTWTIAVPFVESGEHIVVRDVHVVVAHPLGPLQQLRRRVDRWFLFAATGAVLLAVLLSSTLASRVSQPIRALAEQTSQVDIDRLNADFSSERTDEIGTLTRLLGAMTNRLRIGRRQLRDAERRATVGEIARQVNHDIKNGLTPIRNILGHLAEVAARDPDGLAEVFSQRQKTLNTSITYLETLARNYARLYPHVNRQPCDINAIARQVVSLTREDAVPVETRLARGLPLLMGDEVVLRRILENLIGNAVESCEGQSGKVLVSTEHVKDGGDLVRITVSDSGRGMTREEVGRAFDDFYTTKDRGTGLGLSVVRRLVMDLNGAIRVDTEPGVGSRFAIDFPAMPIKPPEPADWRTP